MDTRGHLFFRKVAAAWVVGASACLFVFPGESRAQGYPNRPIRMVVAHAPGGLADNLTRITALALSQRLGVPINVENKPGGSFIIGTEAVVRAAPDGYTLLFSGFAGMNILPLPSSVKLPYDPEKDLLPVTTVATTDPAIVVPTRLGINSMNQFIARARSQPGKMTFASSGLGSVQHLSGEMFRLRTGIDILHVPYKGSQAGMTDAIAGRIDMVFSSVSSALPHMQAGTMKVLAVVGKTRSEFVTDVPTMVELGYPDMALGSWWGLLAPAGTPQEIAHKLAREMGAAAALPDYARRVENADSQVRIEPLAEFAKAITTDRRLWHSVAKEANIKLE